MLANIQTLRFASEATLVGLWGAGFLVLAVLAFLGDRRRLRRKNIDAVGWVPWTALFFVSLFVGAALVSLAVKGWLAG